MMLNNVIISGRLTRDCEQRATTGDYSVLKFSIAYNEYRNVNGEFQETTDYYDVEFWTRYPERKAPRLVKGAFVEIDGALKTDKWEKDGKIQKKVIIKANKVHTVKESKSPGASEPQQGLYDADIPF